MPDVPNPESMSFEEEAFLRAIALTDAMPMNATFVPPLDEASREFVLDHASYVPELRSQFLAWVSQFEDAEIGSEVAQHIARAEFDRPFVDFGGRRARLATLLDQAVTRIQITGPSGAGKTRLALDVLGGAAHRWVDRSAWVDCRSVTSERELIRLIACRISDDPGDWLADSLAESAESRLVVLDGLPASLSSTWADGMPSDVRLVVVSADPIPGFTNLDLGALTDSATEADAAFNLIRQTLFGIRNDLRNIGRVLDPLRGLSAKLASLPIGISLAAGCLAVTPTAEMDASVAHLTDVAAGGKRMAPQQVDEFVTYLLRRLPTEEMVALRALGQLQGPFTLAQARAIGSEDRHLEYLERVGLIQPTGTGFNILDSVRPQLGNPGALTPGFRDLFVATANNVAQLTQVGEWKAALNLMLDNLANILWVAEHGDAPAVGSLFRSVSRLMFEANLMPEFNVMVAAVRRHAELESDTELQIKLLGLEGANATMHRSQEECERLWTERLVRAREFGNPYYIADTLSDLTSMSYELGRYDASLDFSYQTEAIAREHGIVELIASAKAARVICYKLIDQPEKVREELEQVMELLPMCENVDITPYVYQTVVIGFDYLGEFEVGNRMLFALLAQGAHSERSIIIGWSLIQLGIRYTSREEFSNAARCFVAATKVYRVSSSRHHLRAQGRLATFGAQHGTHWAEEFRDLPSRDLVAAVLADA